MTKKLIAQLVRALKEDNDKAKFIEEDDKYYYFNVSNEDEYDFTGTARVKKESGYDDMYYVEFKQDHKNAYRGNGMLEV